MRQISKTIHTRGFTLVEVIATMVLIAIVMPVALKAISLATRMAGHSQRQIQATYVARSKLSELLVSDQWKNTVRSGIVHKDGSDYEWSLERTNTSLSSIYQLNLSVFWKSVSSQRDQCVTLSTLVYTGDE